MDNIAIYGAGGFGKTIACLINSINEVEKKWNFIGYFDDGNPIGTEIFYGNVLGGIKELNAYTEKLAIVIAIGKPLIVEKIVNNICNSNVYYPNLIAPNVLIMDKNSLNIGNGNIVLYDCLLSNCVTIGDFNIFNCGTYLGHDVCVGSFNTMMPSVRISGSVTIGCNNLFGVSSVVLQCLKIGNSTTIGANSVIIRKTKDNNLYLGNPAKKF